jgi:acetolactate synthase-1/2/3 large subunit
MAAVTGELTAAPGAVLVSAGRDLGRVRESVRWARLERAPLIVVAERSSVRAGPCSPTVADVDDQDVPALPRLHTVAKAHLTVEASSAAHSIASAARLAMTEPRGPVWLDLAAETTRAAALPVATVCRPGPLAAPDPGALDEAGRLLASAARPVLVAGLQSRSHATAQWLRALAEALPAAVLVTPKAKGVMPDPHPLHLGLLDAETPGARLLARADLIVAIGVDPVELRATSWPRATPVVHLAPTPADDSASRPRVEVVGGIAPIIEELSPRLRGRQRADWDVAELHRLKHDALARWAPGVDGGRGVLGLRQAVEIVRELAPADTLATVDAGCGEAAVATAWPALAPNQLLVTNAAPPGAFALPAAIAAQLVHADRRVVVFSDAGGVLAARAELETLRRLGLPVLVVVLNLAARPGGGGDVVSIVRRLEMGALAVRDEDALGRAVAQAFAGSVPTLIDVAVAPA